MSELACFSAQTLRCPQIRAEGAIKFERWNDKEGFQRTGLALIASKVEKIGAAPSGKKPTTAKAKSRKNISERMLAAAGGPRRTPRRENDNGHVREKPRIMGRDDFSYSYFGPEQCGSC